MIIDYRSDTVTRPGPAMLQAMITAETGDDVFGEDPTVNRLQEKISRLFEMESALYCASGTMTNQIAIQSHTQTADEVICSDLAHVYVYEGGGMAANARVQPRVLTGDRGRFTAEQVAQAVNPDDPHRARTSLVCIENTVNRGGGCCWDMEEIKKIREKCTEHGLGLHLDGARLFNALVARHESPVQYGKLFDSISICLSKGLGCPVGSLLLGSEAFIRKAHRIRKRMGGGMRQAGILAAAGIYALDHHVERLGQDHAHARRIADILRTRDFIGEILPVETNIVIFEVKGKYTASELSQKLKENDILALAISPTHIRMVFHLDITEEMVGRTCEVLTDLS